MMFILILPLFAALWRGWDGVEAVALIYTLTLPVLALWLGGAEESEEESEEDKEERLKRYYFDRSV